MVQRLQWWAIIDPALEPNRWFNPLITATINYNCIHCEVNLLQFSPT